MNVKILYFASLRETLSCDEESVVLPPEVNTVAALRDMLCARGSEWNALAAGKAVRAAVNQELAQAGQPIKAGDEIAFFPPVTGG